MNALVAFIVLQIALGAFVIWSAKDPVVNTVHVVNGAAVLGMSLVLTLRARRVSMVAAFRRSRIPVPGSNGSAGSPVEARP